MLASDVQVHVLLNGVSADSGTTAQINQGAALNWTYQVTNDGTTSLSGVSLTDDDGAPAIPANAFSPTPSLASTVNGLTLADTIPNATAARFVASANYVFASIPAANNVDVFSAKTLALVATIPVGSTPEGMALSNDGSKLYVADSTDDAISVIDTTTLTTLPSISLSVNPTDVAVGGGRPSVFTRTGCHRANQSEHGSEQVRAFPMAKAMVAQTIR